jgi:hypothetical protein
LWLQVEALELITQVAALLLPDNMVALEEVLAMPVHREQVVYLARATLAVRE